MPPHFLGIMKHNFESLYDFHVNFLFLTKKLIISFAVEQFFLHNFSPSEKVTFWTNFSLGIFLGENFQIVKARRKFVNKNAIINKKKRGFRGHFLAGA